MRCAAIVIVAALLALAAPAHAQDEQPWTDPSGRISLAFSRLGWSELNPRPNDGETVLGIEHRGFQQGGLMRTCFMIERRQPVPDDGSLTQSALNAITTALGPGALERLAGAAAREEIVVVDDVAMVEGVFESDAIWQWTRFFFMSDRGDIVQVYFSCAVSVPIDPDVEANIAALAQTLHIGPDPASAGENAL